MTETLAYTAALTSNLLFAGASLVYTDFTRRVGPLWVNTFKAFISLASGIIALTILGNFQVSSPISILLLMLSGLIGLNAADMFLLGSFQRIGPGRTLVVFGFHPVFVAIGGFLLFDQGFDQKKLLILGCMVGCLFMFSLEKFKETGHWEIRGLLLALCGVLLDAISVLLTRWIFNSNENTSPLTVHMYRSLGASFGFFIFSFFRPIRFWSSFFNFSSNQKIKITAACFIGTFLALQLGLSALRVGHIATLSALSITSPLFATFLELAIQKRTPNRYLVSAFLLFLLGFSILIF